MSDHRTSKSNAHGRRLVGLAVIAAAGLTAALFTGAARADISGDDDFATANGRFDLGIDLSGAGNTAGDVKAFLSDLPADTQRVIMGGCEEYMTHPGSAQWKGTLSFCSLAMGVTPATKSAPPRYVILGEAPSTTQSVIAVSPRTGGLRPSYDFPDYHVYPDDNNDDNR